MAVVLLVAGRRPLHAGEAKVAPLAAEPGALPVFELAAGAQPLHLQPVQEEGQAEREAAVSPRDEAESLWRAVGVGDGQVRGRDASISSLHLRFNRKSGGSPATDLPRAASPGKRTGSRRRSAAGTLGPRPSCGSAPGRDAHFCQSTPCLRTLCSGARSSSSAGSPGLEKKDKVPQVWVFCAVVWFSAAPLGSLPPERNFCLNFVVKFVFCFSFWNLFLSMICFLNCCSRYAESNSLIVQICPVKVKVSQILSELLLTNDAFKIKVAWVLEIQTFPVIITM